MQWPRVPDVARRLARRLPRRWQTRLRAEYRRRLGPTAGSSTGASAAETSPILSVVVATRDSGEHVVACLDSLLTQTLRRLEVLVVDDGSTDDTRTRVAAIAERDPRVRLIRRERAGIGAARNHGAALARGTYLAFVDPGDAVPRTGFALMTKTLAKTGSDFVLGAVQRRRLGKTSRPPWVSAVHQHDVLGTTVDQFPTVMQDVAAVNRVFVRRFWNESVGGFEADNVNGDALAMTTALIRARHFDVLQAVTYHWHDRPSTTSLVAQRPDFAQLDDHLRMLESTWAVIRVEASERVAEGWHGGVLGTTLANYIRQAADTDAAYRNRLAAAAQAFVAERTPAMWRSMTLDRRLRIWLAAHERWLDVELLLEDVRLNGAVPTTRISGGRVYAVLPFLDIEIPEDCLEIGPTQSHLSGAVERVHWDDDSTLVVEGWAFIRGVDLAGQAVDGGPRVHAELREVTTGLTRPVSIQSRPTAAANRWSKQLRQDFAAGGFRLAISTEELVPEGMLEARWQLVFDIDVRGVQRRGALRSQIPGAVAGRMSASAAVTPEQTHRFVPMLDPELGFIVQARPERVRAAKLAVSHGRISGTLTTLGPEPSVPQLVRLRTRSDDPAHKVPEQVLEFPLVDIGGGRWRFEGEVPVGVERRDWAVRMVDRARREHRIGWPPEAVVGTAIGGGRGAAGWVRSSRGYCDVVTDLSTVDVVDATLSDETLTVIVRAVGISDDELETAELGSAQVSVGVRHVGRRDDGTLELDFPLRVSRWGGPELPLPTGTYTIGVPAAADSSPPPQRSRVVAAVDPTFLTRFPIEGLTARHGFTMARQPGRVNFALHLRAPLTDDERGRYAQGQLADWYAETDFEPRDAVLFQCYRGEFATDSQRAIHEELLRRGTDLELLWAVSDYGVALPERAVPLLIGSRDWYAAVGSSRYLCQNIDFDRFFRHRPYQRYLQTFHGYPFKSMGISLWKAHGRSAAMIDRECERRNSAWDAILLPSQSCVEMYRREYRYAGENLVTGYPRDDSILSADPVAVRARVLATLGIAPSKTVVLYAPTWRDTFATSPWTARMFDQLDLDALAADLGEEFTLLVRGHNYNLREGGRGTTADVLDVTSYPEINDLILAADVAVLDYSSLRFDWLITEKPLVFFVPDFEDYLSARRALFDFDATAPGPLLSSTEQVRDALRDLDRVRVDWAAERRMVNKSFNHLNDGRAAARVVDAFFS